MQALQVRADGCYVDGTFGRGGHSRKILQQLGTQGRLLGFDKDPQAIAAGQELAQEDSRFVIVQRSFAQMRAELEQRALLEQVSGILLDLGVSSPQLDDATRGVGFTTMAAYMQHEPLRRASALQTGLHRHPQKRNARHVVKNTAKSVLRDEWLRPLSSVVRISLLPAPKIWQK